MSAAPFCTQKPTSRHLAGHSLLRQGRDAWKSGRYASRHHALRKRCRSHAKAQRRQVPQNFSSLLLCVLQIMASHFSQKVMTQCEVGSRRRAIRRVARRDFLEMRRALSPIRRVFDPIRRLISLIRRIFLPTRRLSSKIRRVGTKIRRIGMKICRVSIKIRRIWVKNRRISRAFWNLRHVSMLSINRLPHSVRWMPATAPCSP